MPISGYTPRSGIYITRIHCIKEAYIDISTGVCSSDRLGQIIKTEEGYIFKPLNPKLWPVLDTPPRKTQKEVKSDVAHVYYRLPRKKQEAILKDMSHLEIYN